MTSPKEIEILSNISASQQLAGNVSQKDLLICDLPSCGLFHDREITVITEHKITEAEVKFFCNPLRIKQAAINTSKLKDLKPNDKSSDNHILDIWSPYTRDSGKQVQELKHSIKSNLKDLSKEEVDALKSALMIAFRYVFREKKLPNEQKQTLSKETLDIFSRSIKPAFYQKFSTQISWAISHIDARVFYGVLINALETKFQTEAQPNHSALQNRAILCY